MREESSRLGGHLVDLVSVFSQLMTKTSFITIISTQVQHSSGQSSKTKSAHGDLRGGRKWKKWILVTEHAQFSAREVLQTMNESRIMVLKIKPLMNEQLQQPF